MDPSTLRLKALAALNRARKQLGEEKHTKIQSFLNNLPASTVEDCEKLKTGRQRVDLFKLACLVENVADLQRRRLAIVDRLRANLRKMRARIKVKRRRAIKGISKSTNLKETGEIIAGFLTGTSRRKTQTPPRDSPSRALRLGRDIARLTDTEYHLTIDEPFHTANKSQLPPSTFRLVKDELGGKLRTGRPSDLVYNAVNTTLDKFFLQFSSLSVYQRDFLVSSFLEAAGLGKERTLEKDMSSFQRRQRKLKRK